MDLALDLHRAELARGCGDLLLGADHELDAEVEDAAVVDAFLGGEREARAGIQREDVVLRRGSIGAPASRPLDAHEVAQQVALLVVAPEDLGTAHLAHGPRLAHLALVGEVDHAVGPGVAGGKERRRGGRGDASCG